MTRGAVGLLLLCLAVAAHAEVWHFGVYLDGKRIGAHRFEVLRDADGSARVTSQAAFDVKVLAVPVFRYRHTAEERWRDGCLEAIDTKTVVNGERTALTGRPGADGFTVEVRENGATRHATLPACIASFAYWDAQTLSRHRELLNSQTGDYQVVEQRARVLDAAAQVDLVGRDFRIDLGYSGNDGRWQWLRTQTQDGRRLEYRLEPPDDAARSHSG